MTLGNSPFFTFDILVMSAQILAFFLALGIYNKYWSKLVEKPTFCIISIWIIWISLEFWVFGPHSFIQQSLDLQVGLSTHLAGLNHSDGVFSHGLAGGTDLAASSLTSGQFFSLERLLISMFPLWMANAFAQILGKVVSFIGTYLLCRRAINCSKLLSLSLSAFYSVSINYLAIYGTWVHGLGYSLIPLAIYLVIFKFGKPKYYMGVGLIAVVHAVSSSPTHSDLSFYPALLVSALLISVKRLLHIIPSILIILLFSILNWADSVYAKFLVAPYTFRAEMVQKKADSLEEFLVKLFSVKEQYIEEYFLLSICIILLCIIPVSKKLTKLTVIFFILVIGSILEQINWKLFGLGFFSTLSFNSYLTPTSVLVAIIILSQLEREIGPKTMSFKALSSLKFIKFKPSYFLCIIVFSLAIAQSVRYKAINLSVWISEGGISQTQTMINSLRDQTSWHPPDPFRVVTVPYRIAPQIPLAAGLHTFDGNHSLIIKDLALYWMYGILRNFRTIDDSYLTLHQPELDYKCCNNYDISDFADTRLLGVANVSHIISILPLKGNTIEEKDKINNIQPPIRNTLPLRDRVLSYLRQNFYPPPIRIYKIKDYLPRVYPAREILAIKAGGSSREILGLISANGLDKIVYTSVKNFNTLGSAKISMRVNNYSLETDTVNASISAPEGGVLIVNIPFSSHWYAYNNGESIPIVPVNLVQMAIPVAKGSKTITLRYKRPTIVEKIFSIFGND